MITPDYIMQIHFRTLSKFSTPNVKTNKPLFWGKIHPLSSLNEE